MIPTVQQTNRSRKGLQHMQNGTASTGGSDMSWARAIVLATGFFFISAIYLGQIPAFFSLAYTQAQLHTASQATLSLGLLAAGLALIAITASFIYDPKPLSPLLPPLFGLIGVGLAGIGVIGMGFVFLTGHHFFPDQTVTVVNGNINTNNWPDPSHGWFLNQYWFQPQSVDIGSVSFIAFITGMGMLTYALLYYPWRNGKLTPVVTAFIMRLAVGAAGVLLLAYLTVFTFSPNLTVKTYGSGAIENVILVLALGLVLFALQVWMLQVMTAPGNRQRYMPSMYLHGVMLLGNVAVPLLGIFVVLYPVVNWMYNTHFMGDYWVQCAIKVSVPDSCTFTPDIGYIIAGIVGGMLFTFLIAAGYLWNRKPAFVKLGSTFAFVFAAIAVVATHDTSDPNHPNQLPVSLMLAIGIAILGVIWTVATQREFVPQAARNVALGCTGQWLVMGTLLFIYLAAFGLFSYPQFFDTEQNLISAQGPNALHDAYWVLLIAGGLAAMQFAFLSRRDKLGSIRKMALWAILIGGTMEVVASVHFNLSVGFNPTDGGNPVNVAYFAGVIIEAVGILIALYGALATKSIGLAIANATFAFIGIVGAFTTHALGGGHDDVVVAFSIIGCIGAILYTIYGQDAPDRLLARFLNRNQALIATAHPPAATQLHLEENTD
jgi:hypothetical protein